MQPPAHAQVTGDEAVVDLVVEPAGAGIGWLLSAERSPYRGDGRQHDLAPVYLYEGRHVFLRSDRVGWRLAPRGEPSIDVYLRRAHGEQDHVGSRRRPSSGRCRDERPAFVLAPAHHAAPGQ